MLRFSLIAISMIAFSAISNATTTIDFYVNLTDNCTACPCPYSGNYCANITIKLNGSPICQHNQCNLTDGGTTQVTWVCDQNLSQYLCTYVIIIDICRFTPPSTLTCCQQVTTTSVCWSQLTSGLWTDYVTVN
jgi:hypothetical protein